MSFSSYKTSCDSKLSSTSYCDKQLKVVLAGHSFVEIYDDALVEAKKTNFASVSTYLRTIGDAILHFNYFRRSRDYRDPKYKGVERVRDLVHELALFGLQTLLANRKNPNEPDTNGQTALNWIIRDLDVRF